MAGDGIHHRCLVRGHVQRLDHILFRQIPDCGQIGPGTVLGEEVKRHQGILPCRKIYRHGSILPLEHRSQLLNRQIDRTRVALLGEYSPVPAVNGKRITIQVQLNGYSVLRCGHRYYSQLPALLLGFSISPTFRPVY